MQNIQIPYILPVLFLVLLLSGCGATGYGIARIDSEPQGAEIINLRDNSHLGSTPADVVFTGSRKSSESITVELVKPGYRERITSFWINTRHKNPKEAKSDPIDVKVQLEKE